MIYGNYHTHTSRCGHARGLDEDYVKGAIALGIKELGFSDHVPLRGINGTRQRMNYELLDEYVSSILELKEKYKDQISIHIGFEAEYDLKYLDDYNDYLKNRGIEYLICGQHCYIENGEQVFYNKTKHSKEMVTKYIDALISAVKSGLFKYICHPDLFMDGYGEWDDFTISESKRFLSVAEEYDIPIEVNCCGLRFYYQKHKINPYGKLEEKKYPWPDFWALASTYNVRTIIGIDTHDGTQFLDGTVDEALEIVKKYNLKLIDKLDI